MFDYVFVKGEGNKGASYKYTWKPDWRMPPGVSGARVALQVAFLCAVAAIPVWMVSSETKAKQPDVYMIQKQKAREERMRWIQSDDMPVR